MCTHLPLLSRENTEVHRCRTAGSGACKYGCHGHSWRSVTLKPVHIKLFLVSQIIINPNAFYCISWSRQNTSRCTIAFSNDFNVLRRIGCQIFKRINWRLSWWRFNLAVCFRAGDIVGVFAACTYRQCLYGGICTLHPTISQVLIFLLKHLGDPEGRAVQACTWCWHNCRTDSGFGESVWLLLAWLPGPLFSTEHTQGLGARLGSLWYITWIIPAPSRVRSGYYFWCWRFSSWQASCLQYPNNNVLP